MTQSRISQRRICTRSWTSQTAEADHVGSGAVFDGTLLTSSKHMPKQIMKMSGPAISASSIIRSSTGRRGLRTVNDFARMCQKLIPSSSLVHLTSLVRILIKQADLPRGAVRLLSRLFRMLSTNHQGTVYSPHSQTPSLVEPCCLERYERRGLGASQGRSHCWDLENRIEEAYLEGPDC